VDLLHTKLSCQSFSNSDRSHQGMYLRPALLASVLYKYPVWAVGVGVLARGKERRMVRTLRPLLYVEFFCYWILWCFCISGHDTKYPPQNTYSCQIITMQTRSKRLEFSFPTLHQTYGLFCLLSCSSHNILEPKFPYTGFIRLGGGLQVL
jgi:hypothetical protein